MHPAVSFSLKDTTPTSTSPGTGSLVSVHRSKEGVLGRWRQLWGRSGVERVAEFGESDASGTYVASGFFSLTAAHNKSSQYICEPPFLA